MPDLSLLGEVVHRLGILSGIFDTVQAETHLFLATSGLVIPSQQPELVSVMSPFVDTWVGQSLPTNCHLLQLLCITGPLRSIMCNNV
jgi:hypothetical protein